MAGLGSLDPMAIQQWFDNNGDPLAGGKLHFYLSGTDTPSPVFADQGLVTPLANPLVLDAGGRAPMHFLDALSYKEVLKTAADVTVWTADPVTAPAALRNTQLDVAVSGTQHNIPVPSGLITFVRFQNTGTLNVTGFSGGSEGQLLVLRAVQAGQVNLLHVDPGTPSPNQLYNFVSSGPTSLSGTSGTAVYIKSVNFWTLITHEQGRWINVPYSVNNFNVQGTGSWTVESADVKNHAYYLKGTNVMITVYIDNSVVAGNPSFLNIFGLPYVFGANALALPATISTPTAPLASASAFFNIGLPALSLTHTTGGAWPAMSNQVVLLQVSGTAQ